MACVISMKLEPTQTQRVPNRESKMSFLQKVRLPTQHPRESQSCLAYNDNGAELLVGPGDGFSLIWQARRWR